MDSVFYICRWITGRLREIPREGKDLGLPITGRTTHEEQAYLRSAHRASQAPLGHKSICTHIFSFFMGLGNRWVSKSCMKSRVHQVTQYIVVTGIVFWGKIRNCLFSPLTPRFFVHDLPSMHVCSSSEISFLNYWLLNLLEYRVIEE